MRSLVAVATALLTLGLALGATASAKPRAERPASVPVRVTLEGPVVDWRSAVPTLTIDDPDAIGGSRRVRRIVRALDEVTVAIGPRTRIVTEDEDGVRERIDAGALLAEIDESEETLSVTVVASVVRRAGRPTGISPRATATRVVLHLPASTDDAGDVDDEEPEAADGEQGLDDPLPGVKSAHPPVARKVSLP